MIDHPRIAPAPDVLAGKPVVRGTRLAVEFVVGLMADGWSEIDILEHCPGMTHEDVLAGLAHAGDALGIREDISDRGLTCGFLPTRPSQVQPFLPSRRPDMMSRGSDPSLPG